MTNAFQQTYKKIVALTLIVFVLGIAGFSYLEPQTVIAQTTCAGGVACQDSVIVTLNVTAGITISNPADTSMSTNLGVATNVAVGTTTWNVKTNSSTGYTLTLAASTNPAMKSGSNSISDYATTTNPSLWSVGANTSKFGFSVNGTDVNTTTWGTGNFCNGASTSTVSTTLKYYGFYTTATTTASRAATTTTSGIDTNVCYAVEQNGFYIPSGVYTATITATATTI